MTREKESGSNQAGPKMTQEEFESDMRSRVERLQAEGRMPSFERVQQAVMREARAAASGIEEEPRDMSTRQYLGMPKEEYNALASAHSRSAIFWWFVGGLGYTLIDGRFLSWPTLLLVLPGIFVASLLSMITFWIDVRTKQRVSQVEGTGVSSWLTLSISTIVLIVTFLFELFVPVAFLMACYRFLGTR